MSSPSPSGHDHDSRVHALALAGLGFKVVPIPAGEKFPKGLPEWQKQATCETSTIERWFKDPSLGVGWAMGAQPNGLNLAGIDVDVANGKQGWASLRDLDVRFDLRPMIKNTITSVTGSDGRHLIVDTGGVLVTNGRLGPGLDLRGEGGFLVVPPSVHPNGNRYRWIDGKEPWSIVPFEVDATFADFLLVGEGVVPPAPRPAVASSVAGDEISPADWCRENLRIGDLLVEGGWTYSHSNGGDHYWTRPDKSARDGHSAVLHDDAPLVVWSTSAPAAFWRAGRDARDGSRVLSPLEVVAAVRHHGDVRAASAAVRQQMPRVGVAPTMAASAVVEATPVVGGLNLPDEFWASRDVLRHIRTAAHARLVSPDATLIGVLARFAAIVPASYRLPALVGDEATFDFIGCSVASSSGGKSIANRVARALLPIERTDVLMDQPIGSGEGLVQAFMVDEIGDDGKKTGRQIVGKAAIHFTVDEGRALIQQQARKGTTIVETLCSAWTGDALGQLNAAAETRRTIEAKRVRISAVINMQTANGHLLLDDANIGIGLPQRIVFAYAHAQLPDLDDLPEWPGPLRVPFPAIITGKHTVLEVLPEIEREIRQKRLDVGRETTILGRFDGHLDLQRLKIAGLLALLDDRRLIDQSDWDLAGTIISSSIAIRQMLVDVKTVTDRDRASARGVAISEQNMAMEGHTERVLVNRAQRAIEAAVRSHGPIKRKALKSKLNRQLTAAAIVDQALSELVQLGRIKQSDDGSWVAVGG